MVVVEVLGCRDGCWRERRLRLLLLSSFESGWSVGERRVLSLRLEAVRFVEEEWVSGASSELPEK